MQINKPNTPLPETTNIELDKIFERHIKIIQMLSNRFLEEIKHQSLINAVQQFRLYYKIKNLKYHPLNYLHRV